jgi:hypothetical protein
MSGKQKELLKTLGMGALLVTGLFSGLLASSDISKLTAQSNSTPEEKSRAKKMLALKLSITAISFGILIAPPAISYWKEISKE